MKKLIGYKCINPRCDYREIYTIRVGGCPECGKLPCEYIYSHKTTVS